MPLNLSLTCFRSPNNPCPIISVILIASTNLFSWLYSFSLQTNNAEPWRSMSLYIIAVHGSAAIHVQPATVLFSFQRHHPDIITWITTSFIDIVIIVSTYMYLYTFSLLFMIVNTKSGWVHANQYGETKNWPQRGQIGTHSFARKVDCLLVMWMCTHRFCSYCCY